MTPHSILAVTDFSRSGDLALARAALLCAQHDATLELLYLYLAPCGQHPPPDAVCRLAHHALQFTQRHDIRARVLRRVEADVLVVPRGFQAASAARASRRLALASPVVRRVRAGAPRPPERADGSWRPSPRARNLRPSAQVLE